LEPAEIQAEDLLPHRGRMKLVDEIITVSSEMAVTRARVTDQWPFFDGQTVNSLVLIELVAQTAGISNSWGGKKKHGENFVTKGWLVGIKESRFYIDSLPLDTRIITRCVNQFEYDSYRVIRGTVEIEKRIVAEVELQLVQSDAD
jgi:predicted hotdog family 3-hydroxylacyl-ACP dehydratase